MSTGLWNCKAFIIDTVLHLKGNYFAIKKKVVYRMDLCRKNLKNLIKILVGLFKMKFNCDSWRIPYELRCYLLKNSYDWDLVCWKLCRCYKSVRLDLITFQSLFTLINWIADYNDACTVCSVTQIKTSQSYSQ